MHPYPHCVKSVRIRSFSGPYFPAFGLNTERYGVSLLIQSECRKTRARKTPNTDTFYIVPGFIFKIQVLRHGLLALLSFVLLFKPINIPLMFLAFLLLPSKQKSEKEGYIWSHINHFWGQALWGKIKTNQYYYLNILKSIVRVHVSFKYRAI